MTPRPAAAENYHPWTTYIAAREEARRRGETRVGTDHLVLGLLHDLEIVSVLGVTLTAARDAVGSLDRCALAAVGIAADLDAPLLPERELPNRPTAKAVFKDRLPLTPAAKNALRTAARPMRRRQHITPQQLLLALLDRDALDPAATLLARLGVDVAAVRQRLAAPPAAA
ncbi:MAG: Clp protease N-terminal domain-containing protein [Acidimicrobiia bacterium]